MTESRYRYMTCTTVDDVLVVIITEPHVRSDELTDKLQTDLFAVMAERTPRKVVFDFQRVLTISSRGFGAIAAFHQEFVRKQGVQVALCNLSPEVRELLAVIRFIDHRGTTPVLASSATTSNGPPKVKPLFPLVADDVPAAIALLNAVPETQST